MKDENIKLYDMRTLPLFAIGIVIFIFGLFENNLSFTSIGLSLVIGFLLIEVVLINKKCIMITYQHIEEIESKNKKIK